MSSAKRQPFCLGLNVLMNWKGVWKCRLKNAHQLLTYMCVKHCSAGIAQAFVPRYNTPKRWPLTDPENHKLHLLLATFGVVKDIVSGTHFTDVFRQNSNAREYSVCFHVNSGKAIASIFFTWHNSFAVVEFAKYCCDLMTRNRMTNRNFIEFEFWSSLWRHQRKHFPRYWPFVPGIHRSPGNYPHKGQWRGASIFSLICAWINGWVNNGEAGDLRRHRAHYDVTLIWNNNFWNGSMLPWLEDLFVGFIQ